METSGDLKLIGWRLYPCSVCDNWLWVNTQKYMHVCMFASDFEILVT